MCVCVCGLAKGLGKGLPLAQTSIGPIMMTMDREVYAVSACVCVCVDVRDVVRVFLCQSQNLSIFQIIKASGNRVARAKAEAEFSALLHSFLIKFMYYAK